MAAVLRPAGTAALLEKRAAEAAQVAPSSVPRPWASVLGLSLDQLTAWGVLYYSYSVLSGLIARDLELSTQFVAGAFSLTLLVSGLLARPVGRLLDREGARPVLLAGAVVGPLTFAAIAFVEHERSLVLAFAALGLAQSLTLYEPAIYVVVGWFPVARQRSRALLVLTSVGAFASTAFLPLAASLAERFGWRSTVLILAALLGLVSLPVRLAISPARRTLHDHPPASPIAVSPPRGVCHWLGVGFGLQSFASTGTSVYLVWHLLAKGEPLERAALVAGLAGAAQLVGRWLLLPLQRGLKTELRLPLLLMVQACALAVIAWGSGALVAAAVLLFGATAGTMTLERATLTLEWFGPASFGVQSGSLASMAFLARAAAPLAVETLRGVSSYAAAFGVLSICLAGGAMAIVHAHRTREPITLCDRQDGAGAPSSRR